MLNKENQEKCRRIINKYGYRLQTRQVAEECCELALASLKVLRKHTSATMTKDDTPPLRNFREELVDVIVMATQAVMMTGMSADEINKIATEKLDRTLAK